MSESKELKKVSRKRKAEFMTVKNNVFLESSLKKTKRRFYK